MGAWTEILGEARERMERDSERSKMKERGVRGEERVEGESDIMIETRFKTEICTEERWSGS